MACNEGAFGIYNTLWPLYVAALGATPPQIGLVMAAMGISRLLALLPSGLIADKVPPRRMIVGGRLLTVLGMFLFAAAQSWWQLIPAGMILTLGNVSFPAISSTIAESARDERERTRAFTLIYTVGPSLAVMITPAAGGLIAGAISLRAVFVAAGLIGSAAVIAFSTITARPVPHHVSRPATYGDALRQRPVALIVALEFATIFTLTLGVTLIPNYLQEVHGLSTGLIGLFGSCSAVGSILLGVAIARLRPLQRPLNAIGLAVASAGLGLTVLALTGSVPAFAFGYLLRGGFFVAWSLFAAALGQVTSERLRARSFALGELLGGIGYSLAPFLAGWLYDVSPLAPLALAIVLVVPLVLAILTVERTVRRGLPTPSLAEAA